MYGICRDIKVKGRCSRHLIQERPPIILLLIAALLTLFIKLVIMRYYGRNFFF